MNKETSNKNISLMRPQAALVLSIASTIVSALGVGLLGSTLGLIIASVLLALVLSADRRAIWFLSVPLSYALALVLSGDPFAALSTLLTAPCAAVLVYCVLSGKNLSHTVVITSVVYGICIGAMLLVATYSQYGGTPIESIQAYIADMKKVWGVVFDYMSSVSNEEGILLFSTASIEVLKETLKMTAPAVAVITLQILSYGAAKLFRFLTVIFRTEAVIKLPWRVKVMAPTTFLCSFCYVLLLFLPTRSIPFYCCINLLYILLPLSAISGFHCLFGEGGVYRNAKSSSTKVMIIVMVIMLTVVSFSIMITAVTFVLWEAFDIIKNFLLKRMNSDKKE